MDETLTGQRVWWLTGHVTLAENFIVDECRLALHMAAHKQLQMIKAFYR